MALAQYLVVVCILATHHAHSILSSLLRHTCQMASVLRVSTPITQFLLALVSSLNVSGTAIVCLRASVGVFAKQNYMSWQSFYIQERLCDCLYFNKCNEERVSQRVRISLLQESFYGSYARNVLYTLTNVASDYIHGGEIDKGQAQYAVVLSRAETLTGLGRAKICFAALEGLAQSEQLLFERVHQPLSHNDEERSLRHLQNASNYLQDALYEAETWFEKSSRRTLRALELQVHLQKLMEKIHSQQS